MSSVLRAPLSGLSAIVATAAVALVPAADAAAATYRLSTSEASVAEGEKVRIKVRRNNSSQAATVIWRTRDVNTDGGADYAFVESGTVNFRAGDSMRRISVWTYSDGVAESDEVFRVELVSVPQGSRINSPDETRVTVLDGDGGSSPPPPSAPPPDDDDPYVAPVLQSVVGNGNLFTMSWTHPRINLDGGFDMIIDGRDTNSRNRTDGLSQTVGPLNPNNTHCFQVEARYKQARRYPRSETLCVEPGGTANSPPTINGQPIGIAEAGQQWSFTPGASDPDGDQLTFSVRRKPGWTNFNASTGRLAGTPPPDRIGQTHRNIEISVTDGNNQVSLPGFNVEVIETASGEGAALLSWTPPTTRVDGSPLTDLSGYRVYRGQNPGNLTLTNELNNPGVTSLIIDGLTNGRWHFAITAVDDTGRESPLSNIVSKLIN